MIEAIIAVGLALAVAFGLWWRRASPVETFDARLARLSKMRPGHEDWQNSVVDLMKLLDMNSSLANRKKLAREYGWEGEYDGSAEMNLFLMREIRRRY